MLQPTLQCTKDTTLHCIVYVNKLHLSKPTYNVLQDTGVHYNILQDTGIHYNILKDTGVHYTALATCNIVRNTSIGNRWVNYAWDNRLMRDHITEHTNTE